MADSRSDALARDASGQPARGYSWPPAEPGNQLALKSGAWSPRHVDPKAQELLEEVAADPAVSYLAQPAYAATLRSWAVAQSRAELFGAWVFAQPLEAQVKPPRGGARSPVELWLQFVKTAANLADKLGLTPLSRARLGRDVATAEAMASQQLRGWINRGDEMVERDTGGEDA